MCTRLWSEDRIPVLCGGTGLYLDSVIYDFGLPPTPADPAYRAGLDAHRAEHGNLALWERLHALDADAAAAIHPNSYPFVMRALELLEVYGLRKSDLAKSGEPAYDTLFVTPYSGDREALYARIDQRVGGMYEAGLVDEVRDLLEHGHSPDLSGFATIGYAETLAHLRGEMTLYDTVELVRQKNRNYAKRQITWFRKYPVS